MKRKAKLVLLAALLQMSAHAGEQGAAADSLQGKMQKKSESVKQDAPAIAKSKAVRKSVKKSAAAKKKPKKKQDSLTETPPESIEQTLQFRGLRG